MLLSKIFEFQNLLLVRQFLNSFGCVDKAGLRIQKNNKSMAMFRSKLNLETFLFRDVFKF